MKTRFILVVLLAVFALEFIAGCATPSFVAADQTRHDAMYGANGPVATQVAAHPEQKQTWDDLGSAWQSDIDANKGGFKPWWSTPAK